VTSSSTQAADPPRKDQEPGGLSPLLLAGILLLAFLVRIVFLGDFPAVQADEGLWTTSTKNFLLFGDWFMDERRHFFLSPVFHVLTLGTFSLLGPSIEAARLVSVVAGTGSVFLVYLLALRLGTTRSTALAAAAIMALDPWAIVHSRQAMTEAVLMFFLLSTSVMLLGRRRELALAGVFMALAILTKLNAASMGLAFGGYLLLRAHEGGPARAWRRRLVDGAVFGVVALGLAGLGYWAVSLVDPERFVAVFQRELTGEQLGGPASGRAGGRISLSPARSAATLLEILRLNPFLMVYAGLGAVLAVATRPRAWGLLALWIGVGFLFPLVQVYQPVRYFYPAFPALVMLGALFVSHLASNEPRLAGSGRLRFSTGALALILCFGLAYTAMGIAGKRESPARVVADWTRANTTPEDPLLAAAYLATDPSNRAYAHDIVRYFPGGIDQAVSELKVRYIVWDRAEWGPEAEAELLAKYEEVERWPFGAVFRVPPLAGTDTAVP
jgi:4-amino-4-deoxy-L-arabinose transferase-like glycosyltransferase